MARGKTTILMRIGFERRTTKKTIKRYKKPVVFPGGYRAQPHKKGRLLYDVWEIPPIRNVSKERLGYPTQKPKRLLERIIQASRPPKGTILDPFCGCGTTLYATQDLNMREGAYPTTRRKWIGMDIAILSTNLVKDQLEAKYKLMEGQDFTISGIPVSIKQAKDLWKRDPFQFQIWAVEYVGGFCTNKKTRDGGVDGRIYFRDRENGNNELKNMIIFVKRRRGGELDDVRALSGTMDKEGAVFGGMIFFRGPTPDMKDIQVKKEDTKAIRDCNF